jgi:predicted Zn-dependent protease
MGIVGLVGGSGYILYHIEKVPVSGRKRFISVSPEEEEMMSKVALEGLMKQTQGAILPSWHPYTQLVVKVTNRLIAVSGLEDLDWEVAVVNSPQANACVVPGGKIFVFTGLFQIVEDEDGLATVLAHEISHQIARHSSEKMSYANLFKAVFLLGSLAMGGGIEAFFYLQGVVYNFLINLPHSRMVEKEADYIGLHLMSQACYNPVRSVKVWENMAKFTSQSMKPPEYLSSHPSNESRIENIKKWLPDAERRLKESSDCRTTLDMLGGFAKTWNIGMDKFRKRPMDEGYESSEERLERTDSAIRRAYEKQRK